LEEEISKRQKYYLGFIPANKYTFILLLIISGVFLVFLCSCCTFRSPRAQKKEEQQRQQREKLDLRKITNRNAQEVIRKFIKPKKA
jgi:hypothetical protein